jgi:hypothetical protein
MIIWARLIASRVAADQPRAISNDSRYGAPAPRQTLRDKRYDLLGRFIKTRATNLPGYSLKL